MKLSDFIVTIPIVIFFVVFMVWKHRRDKKHEAKMDVLWDRALRNEQILKNPHRPYVAIGGKKLLRTYYCDKCGVEGYTNLTTMPCSGERNTAGCDVHMATILNPLEPSKRFYCDAHKQYTHNAKQCKPVTWTNYKEKIQ